MDNNNVGTRLNKYIASSGICSRRKAGEMVKEGQIKVNGKTTIEPWYLVQKDDVITLKGKVLKPEVNLVYALMNKPKNTLSTVTDDRGRKTVIDLVRAKIKEKIYPVGRLDRNTTGLLLLTNDGDLANKLAHPRYKVQKVYQVTLDKNVSDKDIEKIRKGVRLEEGVAYVDSVSHVKNEEKNIVGVEVHIGWNRVIRRIFETIGYNVMKLDRVYYAGLTKKNLKRGWVRHLTNEEIRRLKHFI